MAKVFGLISNILVAVYFYRRVDGLVIDPNNSLKTKNYFQQSVAAGLGFYIGISGLMPPSLAAISSESLSRWQNAYQELKNLDDNWSTIVKGEGDNIRRKLGTVYSPPSCLNPLCSYDTFVNRFVRENSDDIDFEVFEGPSGELLEALNQADFLAYSSVFSEYGNGGGGADYIEQSRKQVKRGVQKFEEILKSFDK